MANMFLKQRRLIKARLSQSGVTMTEVLVTLVVSVIGLTGNLNLQGHMHKSMHESYQRTQALLLANNMVDRIRTNRYSAACYAITSGESGPFLGSTEGGGTRAGISCTGIGSAATQQMAIRDMLEWDILLRGISEISDKGDLVGAMQGARGCVTLDTTTVPVTYTVTVAWQGMFKAAGEPSENCGSGLYGDENLRRTVSATIQLADLS